MGISESELKDRIDDLVDDAREIESSIEVHFQNRSVFDQSSSPHNRRYHWGTPSGRAKTAQRNAREKLGIWFAEAEELIIEYRPSIIDDFQSDYESLDEYLQISNTTINNNETYILNRCFSILDNMISSIKGIPVKLEIRQLKAKKDISIRLSKDEIQRSRELYENDFIRSSGVIASVALERHLLTMCENSQNIIDYEPNHGINRLAQTLYESDIIDKTTWNDLKSLASIRETCAHPEEPNKHAVKRLINDAEDFIRHQEL